MVPRYRHHSVRRPRRYDRGLQYSTPRGAPVRRGRPVTTTRRTSTTRCWRSAAVHRIGDAEYVLCLSGALRPVDAAELPAIEPVEGAAYDLRR